MRKLFTKNNIMKTIVAVLIIIWMGLLTLISFTNPVIKTVEVPVPCEHVSLEDVNVIEQSVTPHCNVCDNPTQRILYDVKNEITYIYTYYYKYREGYDHMLELKDVEILRIQADGTSAIVKR